MDFHLNELSAYFDFKILSSQGTKQIRKIVYDSRQYHIEPYSLFVALVSPYNDGHRYLKHAYLKGIRAFLVSCSKEQIPEEILKTSTVLQTKDTLAALQTWAAQYRKKLRGKVLAITGSNGKTILKEWLFELFSGKLKTYRSPGSYNSQLGVALSLLEAPQDSELLIIEAGISRKGEMKRLEKMIQPELGILTNIGSAHQEAFSSLEDKLKEKLTLFKHASKLYYPGHQPLIEKTLHQLLDGQFFTRELIPVKWSNNKDGLLNQVKVKRLKDSSIIEGFYQGKKLSFKAPFTDNASLENLTLIITLALDFNFSPEEIQETVNTLSPVEMRLQMIHGENNCLIISDCYNNDLNSFSNALDYLMQQNSRKRKRIILSDMLQSGMSEEELYHKVADLIQKHDISFTGIGPSLSKFSHLFPENAEFYKDTAHLLKHFEAGKYQSEAILVKGARAFKLERVVEKLSARTHKTILEINLEALKHNLQAYRKHLKPETAVMAMVKAFSYGSGSHEIASFLEYHHVDYLAVAYTDEGIHLRKNGINLPVMVMSPTPADFSLCYEYELEPEIYSLELLQKLDDFTRSSETNQSIKIHLKLDTGMHRLGIEKKNLPGAIQLLANNKKIKVETVFSHLASSEQAEDDSFTHTQVERFENMYRELAHELSCKPRKHILNSAGILRFPQYQFDMVRLGLGLYGIDITGKLQSKLTQIGTLKTRIIQIKEIKPPETVGYNRMGKIVSPKTIATIGIGYADGLPRSLSNGKGKVFVHHKPAPIIGNICMDLTMIDITGIEAHEGEEVIIFSPEHPVEELATAAGTIPYEILTGISSRIKRIYFKE